MDDSDEELEPFHMTGDEFMPKRRKMTKKDHIYGMWADPDSDDEDDRRKDYSRPVNFVSSKTTEESAKGEEGDSDSDVEDLDEEARAILKSLESKKLEKGGVKTGVGKFTSAALDKNKTLGMFSGSAGKGADNSKQKQPAKKRVFQTGHTADRDFGGWERYSSGFGSKMLAKMGWEKGMGLGAKGEGIVNPVKATKHTEFGKGLAHMQVNKSAGVSVVEAVDSEDEEEQKQFEAQLQQWKKTEVKEAKPKYNYMTVEDLMHSGKQYKSQQSKSTSEVKVIDMTGPRQRVLTSYEEIHNRHAHPDQEKDSKKLYVGELLHNIELLVETTEQDILQSDRKLHHNRDLVVNLGHEREGLLEEVAAEEEQMEKLADILSTIEVCDQKILSKEADSALTLEDCENMMTSLMEKYPTEYKIYELSSVAVAIVFPLIKASLKGWDMLSDPTHHVEVFSVWRGLLQEHETLHGAVPSSENMDPYDRLVWEVWMPGLRQVVTKWNPRHCDPLITLLESWSSLLPVWVMDNIKHQLILPRLQSEVESWDPTTDTMPIHRWVHPWLPLMKADLEVLYGPIRHKLAMALNNWHPSDSSAHKILEPWVQVFSQQTMDMFVLRTILPKLIYCLQMELQINPHQQNIAPFEWVMAWRDMIGAHHYANMLDKYFFPKWIQVLVTWLSSNPNFDEISKWYSGWKSILDVDLLREPAVKHHLNHALDLMNRAVAGNFQPGARENMAYLISTERRNLPSIQNAVSAPASVSFKDVIEKMALDNGILFMPVPGQKRHEGKALYNFGRATMYIDRSVAFVLRGTVWTPVSLDDLLKCA